MAHKAIREFDGKSMLGRHVPTHLSDRSDFLAPQPLQVHRESSFDELEQAHPWVTERRLVAKPDQLIKRPGDNALILLDASWNEVEQWIGERMHSIINADGMSAQLTHFIVEPFIPHREEDEYYLAIRSTREGAEILFHHQGGVAVGDVDDKAKRLAVGILEDIDESTAVHALLSNIPADRRPVIARFVKALFRVYTDASFVYLEINPLAFVEEKVALLDLAAKLDDTAEFECGALWGELTFPPPFGRAVTEEERFISRLDADSGASLKLTILQPQVRVWTMVAGGGASVIYADTVADLGWGEELANYGEYSGNPSEEETYEYARTVLSLMTREKDPAGRDKVLLVGGGIANFTDVSKTFGGICRAIREFADELKRVGAQIYVRRGGPNHKEGLLLMKGLGQELGIPLRVYGSETHMTKIVTDAPTA